MIMSKKVPVPTLWSIVEKLQNALEKQGLSKAEVDAAILRSLTLLASGQGAKA